jgi:hypothetical protein
LTIEKVLGERDELLKQFHDDDTPCERLVCGNRNDNTSVQWKFGFPILLA